MGGAARQELHGGATTLADVLTAALWSRKRGLVSRHGHSFLVSFLPSFLRSNAGSLGARRFPVYLLLLSRRLLQGFLGGPAELYRGRAEEEISRRAQLPSHNS